MSGLGKQVGSRRYVTAEQVPALPANEKLLLESAITKLPSEATYNLLRIDPGREEVAFLYYPGLGIQAFPSLAESWRVHAPTSLVTRRSYSNSLNPPILHRTELLLSAEHPIRSRLERLTRSCEEIGLFDNTTIIGFQRNWNELIASKGYALDNDELVPLGNMVEPESSDASGPLRIERHRTALSRSSLSAPVQCLLRDSLLSSEITFFDYGCGKGDDLAALGANGFSCSGWDPYFRPDAARTPACVVNIGFVINVIEDVEERVEALTKAFGLAEQVIVVAAMLSTNAVEKFAPYKDGVVTSRATFQKYFTQSELQHFIESVLGEDAYSAAPGVFYVFKDRAVEQSYLLSKSSNRSRVARARLALIEHVRAPRLDRPARPERTKKLSKMELPDVQDCIGRLWETCLELGREPEADEIVDLEEVKRLFGSASRATNACLRANDATTLRRAADGRRDDILVMLALRVFERRRHFEIVGNRLKRDLRAFFGSAKVAEAKSHELLFSVQDGDVIRRGCEEAASQGLGWLESEHSLQLHTSLVERLPASLRVYIGCATAMAGDLSSFDLVKVHIDSGKVSLMAFDDFDGRPLPALKTRIKVRLRDQDMDVFAYGGAHRPTVLFRKSRYINEEFPNYAEQIDFEERLEELNLFDLSNHGPPVDEVTARLRSARWEVEGFNLRRCIDIPDLEEKCGSNYTFANLINCGETWDRLRVENSPKSPETYSALNDLAVRILDPVIEYFGSIRLTYAFASRALTKNISGRIEPGIDQHASCELSRSGKPICSRLGAAVDFLVEYEDMRDVAKWIATHCIFDRIYFYGSDRPLHVSVGPEVSRKIYELIEHNGRRVPRVISIETMMK